MSDVVIIMGSTSDLPVVEKAKTLLQELDVTVAMRVGSAHRTPEHVRELIAKAESEGTKVFICAAGGAAHLAGAVAALTARPVVGIPLAAGALGGVDALYSTCNMPPGMPVATVSVGSWGATNAALLAAQILAVADDALHERLCAWRAQKTSDVIAKDQELQAGDSQG